MPNELAVTPQNVQPVNTHLEVMGLIVASSPNGEGNLGPIQDAFAEAGFGQYAPDMRSQKEALRVALVAAFSRKNRRVAPCGKGYEVTEEIEVKGTMRNDHVHVLSAYCEVDGRIVVDTQTFTLDGIAYTDDDVRNWASAARRRVDGSVLGESIASVCMALHGVSIRDAGGTYWLPSTSIASFVKLKDELDRVGCPARIAMMDMANTPRSVESTITRIESLVDRTCDDILTSLEGNTLGVRALDTKTEEATNLIKQLSGYESVLDRGLAALRDKVVAVKDAVLSAAMEAQRRKEQAMVDRRMAQEQSDADSNA